MKEKATGWRIPLLFSAVIVTVAIVAYQFMPGEPKTFPEVPPELQARAAATVVDLELPENLAWRDALIQAGSGFVGPEVKDARLQEVISRALAAQKMDIACAGAAMLHSGEAREETLDKLLEGSLASCGLLHYGICALRGGGESSARRAKILTDKFWECEKREHTGPSGGVDLP